MIVQFKQWKCDLEFLHYENNRIAIRLNDAQGGDPVATATVNMPEIPLKENQVLIKNYSENEGMTEALVEAGVVTHILDYSIGQFDSRVALCELLDTNLINMCQALKENQVLIKNYSENEGMTEALVDAGVVLHILDYSIGQFDSRVALCELLIKPN